MIRISNGGSALPLRLWLLTGTVLCNLVVTAPALAQSSSSKDVPTAQTPAEEATPGDDIVVRGSRPIAESEKAALQVQKASDSLVAVLSSDAAGRLPDQNIAQATGRLPGLAVERDQGQARYISIRGAPNNWTTLSFDGINVVSPEGRDARFDSIPSAIAKLVIVSKAVTPDMPGETVSGNVNIVTRSAFDYDKVHVAAKLGYGRTELGNRPEYEASLVVADRFDVGGGEIGVLLSGTYYERNMLTDNFENDFERVAQDQRPGSGTRFWIQETENKLYRLTRKNFSATGRLDWKPDANNTISLRSVYTVFSDDEARDNYRFDLDDRQGDLVANTAACATTINPTPTTSGYADVCIGNTPLVGTVYGVDIRQRATLRAFRQSIFTNTLAGDHDFGAGWKLGWIGNYTESKDDRSTVGEASFDSPSTRTLRPTVSYDATNPQLTRVQLFTTQQLASPTRFQAGTPVAAIDSFIKPLTQFTVLDAVDTTKAYTGRLVLAKATPFLGGNAAFKLGFQFDQRTKVVDESRILLNTAAQFSQVGIPTDFNNFSDRTPFAGAIPLGYTFQYFNTNAMRRVSNAAREAFAFTPNIGNIYDVREQVFAGYAMGTAKWDWGSLIGGVRVEHIKNRGIAIATIGATTANVTAEASQTLVFPSAHFNYNIDDTKKLRLSFNTGAARADYDQLRPNVTINDPNETISGGNPAVQPERAYGFDGYFEWYLRPQGYLMFGAFYKRVDDVLYSQRRSFGSDALNSNGIDRSAYVFSGITNGGTGRIFGIEAAAQLQLDPWTQSLGLPEWLGGFGINANVTVNDSEVTKPTIGAIPARRVRLPGTSDLVYNIGGYYEKYGFSARLQYQRRSLWLDGIADDLTDGGDVYWAADDEMDFSMRYAINKNFEVYFDASNLLDQAGRRFSEPGNLLTATGTPTPFSTNQTIEWERFGRRFGGGVRVTF